MALLILLFCKRGSLENLNREKFGSFLRIFRTKLIIKSNYQNNTFNFLIIIMLSSSNVAFPFNKKIATNVACFVSRLYKIS